MAATLQSVYEQKQQLYQEEVRKLDRAIRNLVLGRISVALLFLFLGYQGFSDTAFFYWLPLPAIGFFFLVSRYGKEVQKRNVVSQLVKLNQLELKALNFEFDEFAAGGAFKDEHHAFSYDLDIFGTGSLFQYLNRCATSLGEKRLANDLLTPSVARHSDGAPSGATEESPSAERDRSVREIIYSRQVAIKELGPHLDLRQQLWALGKGVESKAQEHRHLEEWLKEKNWVRGNLKFSLLRWGMPVLTLIPLALTFYSSLYFSVFLAMFAVQWTIVSFYSSRIGKTVLALSRYKEWLENYGQLFQTFREISFQSPLLQRHRKLADDAFEEVKRFSKLVNTLESRMNPIANAFGNGIFSFDFHSMVALEEWRDKNGKQLTAWLESLAEWDALNSFAHFHYTHADYTFPVFTEELSLNAANLGHPLISSNIRIGNPCVLRTAPQVMVITGANMAGKSTFLRAVGVNFVLSQTGAPVCATEWKGPVAELRSGMRTTDSLQDHQSYFFAELARLQSIMGELRAGKKMVVLLDEILKGTNSNDKQAGSRELILQLIHLPGLVLLATHDVVLGNLAEEHPAQILATCFESEIKNDQLHFDYRLKPGVAQTRNATFLMRKMGILPKGD
jgi:MutS domain V